MLLPIEEEARKETVGLTTHPRRSEGTARLICSQIFGSGADGATASRRSRGRVWVCDRGP
jgi:hypothetical protein